MTANKSIDRTVQNMCQIESTHTHEQQVPIYVCVRACVFPRQCESPHLIRSMLFRPMVHISHGALCVHFKPHCTLHWARAETFCPLLGKIFAQKIVYYSPLIETSKANLTALSAVYECVSVRAHWDHWAIVVVVPCSRRNSYCLSA